jgi:hypothetical protein
MSRPFGQPLGQPIGQHLHPQPLLRRALSRLTLLAFALTGLAILAQIWLAVSVAPLFLGTAFFTVMLGLPLYGYTALHPGITRYEDGLYLRPLVWRGHYLPATAILATAAHPFLPLEQAGQSQPLKRLLHGRGYQARQGLLVVAEAGAMPLANRLLASYCGQAGKAVFAISNSSHRAYPELCQWLERVVFVQDADHHSA